MAAPNPNMSSTPLNIAPLTVALPGERVVPTPARIREHPAYTGGWKTLVFTRDDGKREYNIFVHQQHGRIRSLKGVIEILDTSLGKTEKSADPREETGTSQSAGANSSAAATQSGHGNNTELSANQVSEGMCAAGSGISDKGKRVA
ncbi:hypothetical protein ACP4OV_028546 [Aristida adscensionis]